MIIFDKISLKVFIPYFIHHLVFIHSIQFILSWTELRKDDEDFCINVFNKYFPFQYSFHSRWWLESSDYRSCDLIRFFSFDVDMIHEQAHVWYVHMERIWERNDDQERNDQRYLKWNQVFFLKDKIVSLKFSFTERSFSFSLQYWVKLVFNSSIKKN